MSEKGNRKERSTVIICIIFDQSILGPIKHQANALPPGLPLAPLLVLSGQGSPEGSHERSPTRLWAADPSWSRSFLFFMRMRYLSWLGEGSCGSSTKSESNRNFVISFSPNTDCKKQHLKYLIIHTSRNHFYYYFLFFIFIFFIQGLKIHLRN